MPLPGQAAMLLSFEIVPDEVPEHDDWHTHEHLPERLSIPGFLRGTRWTSIEGPRRYFVMYEVETLATLTAGAYLERLNNPSAWTTRMMKHYRGMTRGLCSVTATFGCGVGQASALIRFKPAEGKDDALRQWLREDALPALPTKPGVGSVHLFERAVTPQMTNEQRIRGADAGFDWALVATGYEARSLASLLESELGGASLERQGATGVTSALYRMEYSLIRQEVRA